MIIAVDTGGTKTLIESFDESGNKTYVAKFPTPRDTSDYISKISETISTHCDVEEVDAIAIALPGPIRGNILTRSRNLGWENVDIASQLRELFGASPMILIGNDADIAGLAETRALDATPTTSLYVTLSTGIGAGLCHNGRLSEATAILEAGRMWLHHDSKLGRWEDFASGREFYERTGQYGKDCTNEAIWEDYAERVSAGLLALIPLFEPEHVIIGGSMGTHYQKYARYLDEVLNRSIPHHMQYTTISQAKHPEEAVIHGCYYYAIDTLADKSA